MVGIAQMTDLAAKLFPAGFLQVDVVAAGAGDNVEAFGSAVDRYLLPEPGGAGSPGNPTPLSESFGFGTALGPGGGAASGIKDHGMLYLVVFEAVMADSETLTLNGRVQQSTTGTFGGEETDFEPRGSQPLVTAIPQKIITAPAAGGPHTIRGEFLGRFDNRGLARFCRMAVTPDLSAAGVDTVNVAGTLLFYGPRVSPFRTDGDF